VIRQLLTESLLMAVAGGALGLAVGYAGVRLLRQMRIATDLPIVLDFQLDRRALVFSFVVAVLSALLFGVAPAIRTTRADLTAIMKSSDTVAHGRRRRWDKGSWLGAKWRSRWCSSHSPCSCIAVFAWNWGQAPASASITC